MIRNFEILGEATKHLSKALCDAHSEIPRRRLAGCRDILVRDYMGVDLVAVWGTVEHDLPALEAHLDAILRESEDQNADQL